MCAGYSTVCQCFGVQGTNTRKAGMGDCPASGPSCIVLQQSLWTTCANEMGNRVCRFVRTQESRRLCLLPFPQSPFHPCGNRDPAAHPAYLVEHSPRSRWISGAMSLNRRTPSCSPQVRPVIKTRYWMIGAIPTLYAAHVKMSGVPMPAHMYLFVSMCQGLPRNLRRC